MPSEEEEKAAQSAKEEGNNKFKAGEYKAAIEAYSQCVQLSPEGPNAHLALSNRSACYMKLGDDESMAQALADANDCVKLNAKFAKGYSRQAAALQGLKRLDEAKTACEKGLAACGTDDTLEKMHTEVRDRQYKSRLRGPWYGTVSDTLGGYEQQMEFLDDNCVVVEVCGKKLPSKYWLNIKEDPTHLTIQVPMPDAPPGMPPPPPVPYIVRVDDEGMHLCCPFMRPERPTKFDGPGYCVMKKGTPPSQDNSEIEKLSHDEKLRKCVKDVFEILPTTKLDKFSESLPEAKQHEMMMVHVRMENEMHKLQKRYGEELLRTVFQAGKNLDGPAAINGSKELRDLHERMALNGIGDEEQGGMAPIGEPEPEKAPAAAAPKTATLNGSDSKVGNNKGNKDPVRPLEGRPAASSMPCMIVAGIAAMAAIGAAVFVKRKQTFK